MSKIVNIWNDPAIEKLRDSRREKRGRIAFDCFSLKILVEKNDRVYCATGHHLGWSKDGTFRLVDILKGVTPETCKLCKDFEDMGGEENDN